MLAKRKSHREASHGLRLAIEAVGSRYMLAKRLHVTAQAVQRWTEIPLGRLIQVERVTGVDRSKLRPDLFER